jgi:succinate dehydrogenase / fumarate reductase cytochrome b subunit
VTPPQIAFLVAFLAILAGIVVFAGVVLVAAARNVGDPAGPTAMVRRLSRAPRDRLELGRWGFWAHRVSGVAIFAFLALHLVDVALYGLSRDLYDEVHALYGTVALRVFECGLLVAILFHALNGLRLLAIDLVDVGPRTAGRLLVLAAVATLILGAAGSAIILRPVVGLNP